MAIGASKTMKTQPGEKTMRLIQFQRALPANTTVFVNPDHVVAVDTFGNTTRIHTTAMPSDIAGGVSVIMVVGNAAEIARQLGII
jgi:hypothetical protein